MKFDKKLTTSDDINDATQLRFIPDSESVEALGRMPRKLWQCQNSSCAKTVPNPLRWVEGAKTTFACPYCKSNTVEVLGQQQNGTKARYSSDHKQLYIPVALCCFSLGEHERKKFPTRMGGAFRDNI